MTETSATASNAGHGGVGVGLPDPRLGRSGDGAPRDGAPRRAAGRDQKAGNRTQADGAAPTADKKPVSDGKAAAAPAEERKPPRQRSASAAERLRAAAERARAESGSPTERPGAAAPGQKETADGQPAAAAGDQPSSTAAARLRQIKLPPLPRLRAPRLRLPRLRLLPAMIFCLMIMAGDRAGDIVNALTTGSPVTAIQETLAQEQADPDAEQPQDILAEAAEGPEVAQVTDTAATEGVHAGDGHDADREMSTAAVVDPAMTSGTTIRADGMSDTEIAMLQSLADRRAELDARDRALDQRAALLAVAEQRIDEKLQELRTLRSELEGLLDVVDEQQEAHIASLVRIYENMRPGDAATIFNGLDMDVLLEVLQRMSERKSAPVLAAMAPERAREVTAELALRRQLPELPQD